jgi:hypothetical protein
MLHLYFHHRVFTVDKAAGDISIRLPAVFPGRLVDDETKRNSLGRLQVNRDGKFAIFQTHGFPLQSFKTMVLFL